MSIQTALVRLLAPSEVDVIGAAQTLDQFWQTIPTDPSDPTGSGGATMPQITAAVEAMRLITMAGIYHPEFRHYVPDNAMLLRSSMTESQVLDASCLYFGHPECDLGADAPRAQLLDAMTTSGDIASWANSVVDVVTPFTTFIASDPLVAVRAAALKAIATAALPVELGSALLPALTDLDHQLEVATADAQTRTTLRSLAATARGRLQQAVAVQAGQNLPGMPGAKPVVTQQRLTAGGVTVTVLPPEPPPFWSRWQTWLGIVAGAAGGAALAARRKH